jgi:hypothetical protein
VYRSGPGDIIALMGIAVQLAIDIFCYVPPHDDAQKWNANLHYKSMQFREATALKKKPCIYLVIRGGHFKSLASATTAPSNKQSFSVMDLFHTDTDPATSKYAALIVLCALCHLHCAHIHMYMRAKPNCMSCGLEVKKYAEQLSPSCSVKMILQAHYAV